MGVWWLGFGIDGLKAQSGLKCHSSVDLCILERMKSRLTPIYTTRRVNASINLGHSHIEITSHGQQIQCDGQARFLLLPRLQLIVTADLSQNAASALHLYTATSPTTLRYGSQSASSKVLVLASSASWSASVGVQGKADLLPNPQRLTICPNRRKRLRSVTFHVMNFPAFFCTGTESTDVIFRGQRLGRTTLSNADWHIEFQSLPRARQLVQELRTRGGYAITHVGRLTHRDGRSFTISAAERALQDLTLFLSFARGLWTPLVLPVGFDADGNRIWEEWAVPRDTPWQACFSWFDRNTGQSLAKLYPGFMALLHDVELGKPLRDALYWYLMSNRAGEGTGVDSGIILSHAALERLAVAYLAKMGLPGRSNAADRLRSACQRSKLPIAIPRGTSSVYGAHRKGVWKDIPEAITKVRNELVHPRARLKFNVGRVIPTIWQLAQWYVELFILRHSGYGGVYSNRLQARRVGQVVKVPWVR